MNPATFVRLFQFKSQERGYIAKWNAELPIQQQANKYTKQYSLFSFHHDANLTTYAMDHFLDGIRNEGKFYAPLLYIKLSRPISNYAHCYTVVVVYDKKINN